MNRRVLGSAGALAAILFVSIAHQVNRPVLAAHGLPEPPALLADTGLYVDGSLTVVRPGNRSFVPQYPLWSDGLSKPRWIYLPPGTTIDGNDEHDWKFPVGTKLWKQFSLKDRKVETRLLWKASADGWVTGSYLWNEAGTEAVLAPAEGVPDVLEVAPGRRISIPSRTDCTACHGTKPPAPLGFNALQLSSDRDPNAIHGEKLGPDALTVVQLSTERLLAHARPDLAQNPPRIRTANADTRAALGYLAANCGVCHDGKGEIAALGPTLRHRDLVADGDAVARSLINQPTRWQLPGIPDGHTVLVKPGAPDGSALLVRMRSRAPSSQMPPLGSVVRDQHAVETLARWIASYPLKPR
ncbi:MAG: hypothetical protein H0W53_17290 [Acidobacteria bacterium]|nr:hypothetical protein [Acidobacteriota bacterium]